MVAVALVGAGCGGRSGLGQPSDGAPPSVRRDLGAGLDPGHAPDRARLADVAAPLTRTQEVLRACAIAASCLDGGQGDWPAASASRCIDSFGGLDFPQGGYAFGPSSELAQQLLACAAKVSKPAQLVDCGAFRACYGGSWFYPTLSYCREGGYCKGSVMVGGYPSGPTYDCAVLGASCVALPTGAQNACCAKQGCGGSSQVTCAGTKGTGCVLGVAFSFDCGPSGRVCTTDPAGYLCAGTGAACPASHKTSCAGSLATYCSAGKLATMGCAANAFRSACVAAGYQPCGPSGKECSPESFKGECAPGGKTMAVCLDGRRTPVDCGALGFELCYPASDKGAARCGFLMD
jgi:hypothetical protein